MLEHSQKALELMGLADEKSKIPNAAEDAANLYVEATSSFKLANDWSNAGNAYVRAAEMNLQDDSKIEAMNNYIHAKNCFKRIDIPKVKQILELCNNLAMEEKQFSKIAKFQQELAEMYEEEKQYPEAIVAFTQAAKFYDLENMFSASNVMLLKVAYYEALINKNYDDAAKLYEQVAEKSLKNSILKFNVKNLFLDAFLCHLASKDLTLTEKQYTKYRTQDPSFGDTREGIFCANLLDTLQRNDNTAFMEVVKTYDNITRLDEWKSTLLLTVKN